MPRIPVSSWRCTFLPGFRGSTFSCRAATNSPWRILGRKWPQSWEPPEGDEDDDNNDDDDDDYYEDNDDDDDEDYHDEDVKDYDDDKESGESLRIHLRVMTLIKMMYILMTMIMMMIKRIMILKKVGDTSSSPSSCSLLGVNVCV